MDLSQLRETIKQHFGHPMVNVELHETQLNGFIERAYNYHKKWGVGISTQETFFTKEISAGVDTYDLPDGVHSVINVKDYSSNLGGSQELFTVSNAIYQQFQQNVSGFSLVNYELSMQFIDTLEKYKVSKFTSRYHPFNNSLTLSPTPSAGDMNEYDYMLIRCFMEEGYEIDNDTQDSSWREHLYEDEWFIEYCIALSKITLGMIRRKFDGFDSLGNAGLNLDGDSLLSEGKEEKERLEERLQNETWEGMDISYD